MRQVWIPKIGGPEVLEVREAPDPNPQPGEVRVRVNASGINFADILARMPTFKPLRLMSQNKGVFGVNLGHLWRRGEEMTAMLGEIGDLFADGTFVPMVDKVFPFAEAASAHQYIQDRRNFGKVVLKP